MRRPLQRGFGALLLATLLTGCDRGTDAPGRMAEMMEHTSIGGVDTTGIRALAVPAEHQQGEALFEASCASCHGESALGTEQGPPLVHIIYEPNHHGDAAFILAAERGVRAHHWGFGDMLPVPGVTREEVAQIVGYVRWLQREAGVY